VFEDMERVSELRHGLDSREGRGSPSAREEKRGPGNPAREGRRVLPSLESRKGAPIGESTSEPLNGGAGASDEGTAPAPFGEAEK